MESTISPRWKFPTKIVAIIDIVLGCLGLIATLVVSVLLSIGIYVAASQPQQVNTDDESNSGGIVSETGEPELKQNAIVFMIGGVWGFAIFFILIIGFQIFAAVGLLKSTEYGIPPTEAKSKAKLWLIVSIVGLLLQIVGNIISGYWMVVPVYVVIRLLFIAIVWNFMYELGFNWTPQNHC